MKPKLQPLTLQPKDAAALSHHVDRENSGIQVLFPVLEKLPLLFRILLLTLFTLMPFIAIVSTSEITIPCFPEIVV